MGRQGAAHYETLGVDPSASMSEIRHRYLELARETHPDFHTESESASAVAELRMRKINAAWAVLGNVDERSAYDRVRLSASPRAPFHAGRHGQVDEPDPWQPFDGGPVSGFDERDDRPITTSTLPSWLKTFPALGILFGFAFLMVGSLVNLSRLAGFGLMLLVFSAFLFLVAPLVALSLSKGQDRRP